MPPPLVRFLPLALLLLGCWAIRTSLFITNTLTGCPIEGSGRQIFNAEPGIDTATNFDVVLKHTEGNGWKMWDRQKSLSRDRVSCNYRRFVPRFAPEKNVTMCLHDPDVDVISGDIAEFGRWKYCDALVVEYQHAASFFRKEKASGRRKLFYIEAGANIGSCVLEMLLSTNAEIIAFEPDPRNLAQLTTTLMAMDPAYRNRVALFPIALGSERGSSTIHTAADNRGNALVGQPVPDYKNQMFLPPVQISVEALDDLIDLNDGDVAFPLIKMDVQGFECRVIDGMRKVLGATSSVKSEAESKLLAANGCSVEGMLQRLRDARFADTELDKSGDILARKYSRRKGSFLDRHRYQKSVNK
mmetsp:Transcript_24761/g.53598  ORF Transcript_24761/g.53598 Transcript_24761/m.53598 type:complete len:357 (+) Transcript_24761:188-1258(+)|eukprot:CAMPEP_0178630626 /NCGR_PEP_ID=MMETSP0698-20121128/10587_1 /TAXON_ID=265572 /ORGANISM="Extubocellulus spinifer, Strain CCMP396" /LENGTH=356 /DNA_ID=CAMNT_0020270019 /DNA_START=189 /DNA_END=1259 /DNA_ORIENTATION=+